MADDLFEVDLNELDREWIRQPGLYFKYATKLADAKRTHEQKKARLELTKAELDRDIRGDPEKFNVSKITEATVAATILSQKKYKKTHKKMLDAKHHVDILDATCRTLDHRKSALERLVSLHGQNYFSTPVAQTPVDAETVQRIKERSDAIGSTGTKKPKKKDKNNDNFLSLEEFKSKKKK